MGKAIIVAYQNGVRVGYVKSVSYKNGNFKLTQDKAFAKGYSSNDRLMYDIDAISYQGCKNNIVFSMEV